MTLLNVKTLGVTLGDVLFSDLTLTVSKGDRIGLVAANGRGKSTLLACLAGTLDPTHGDITRARGLKIGHVQQVLPPEALQRNLYDHVLAALPPDQQDYESWRVDVLLDDLSVPYELHHRPLAQLSGGWQRVAMLAAVWITEPDLLLLDEPTNHLDLHRIAQLQDWLAALPRDLPVILTSHDRAFLDAVTNRTLFLRAAASRLFPLPFSAARAALSDADAAEARRHANDLNKAQQLRRQAAKLKNIGINSGSDLLLTKTKQLAARAEDIEGATRPAHQDRSAGDIRLVNSGSHAKALLTLEDLAVTTPDGKVLYRTGQKWISPGDRVVLLGHNGSGKTQLIQRIQRAFDAPEPGLRAAASAVLGYADQHLSQLDPAASPLASVTQAFDLGDQPARNALARAGIGIALQDRPLRALSGGQLSRLSMLMLRLRNPNFYLLDEPTNHLDIEGQEALEDQLIQHQAACLLVSHDRQFLRNTGTRFWWIRKGKLQEVDSPEPFLQEAMQPPPA